MSPPPGVRSLSGTAAEADPEAAAEILCFDGALVVRGVCPTEITDAALEHVNDALALALRSSGEADTAIEYIPWVRCACPTGDCRPPRHRHVTHLGVTRWLTRGSLPHRESIAPPIQGSERTHWRSTRHPPHTCTGAHIDTYRSPAPSCLCAATQPHVLLSTLGESSGVSIYTP
jgi:hypothetical protein